MVTLQRYFSWRSLSRASFQISRQFSSPINGSNSYQDNENLICDPETGIVFQKDTVNGNKPLFQSIIGMEIHAQLDIRTKLFSSAPANVSALPNELVWPFDVAVPGSLPRLSTEAVHAAILSAAACQCEDIPYQSRFERKHYSYADLPSGYQITQQRWPLAKNGLLKCRKRLQRNSKKTKSKKKKNDDLNKFFTVGIDRIQLEQDTGKTTAIKRTDNDGCMVITESLVDFNRAGCALIEIVFRPDIRSAYDASSVVSTLRNLLRHIGTCDGKMEEGSLRCDLNISIAPLDDNDDTSTKVIVDPDNPFNESLPAFTGHRVEVKNLNSIKDVLRAAEYEAIRQAKVYLEGFPTSRETRTFDPRSGKTITIRSKEGAIDYRFMPEPDLPPITLNRESLDGNSSVEEFISKNLNELPEEATTRLMEDYGLAEDVALVITSDAPAIRMYDEAVDTAITNITAYDLSASTKIPTMVANWLCNDLFGLVKYSATNKKQQSKSADDKNSKTKPTASDSEGDKSAVIEDGDNLNHPISVEYSTVNAKQLGLLVVMILDKNISNTMAKKILMIMFNEDVGADPRSIANERNLKLITDPTEIRKICESVIFSPQHKDKLEQYKKGGKNIHKMEKFFTGMTMKESKGNADPELLRDILQSTLHEVGPTTVEE